MTEQFTKFREAVNKAKRVPHFSGRVLSVDPGETTGWALFDAHTKTTLVMSGQAKTWPLQDGLQELTALLDLRPQIVIFELYSVYEWKSDSHAWSQVPTLQIIGMLQTLCLQRGIGFHSQTAQIAKNFCTDPKLESWGMYIKGQRHARDAIRHGAYFLMFGG